MRVVIAGGGTGGHVFPALALADRLVGDHAAQVRFIGSGGGQEARRVPEAGYRFDAIDAVPLLRKVSATTLRAPFVALRSVRRCAPIVRAADVVVGMGGYVSVPAVVAARRARVPIVLHEPNAVLGLANRLAARSASAIAVQFDVVASRLSVRGRVEVVGYPVRASILAVPGSRGSLRAEAARTLDLDPGRTTALVFGGSQGALHVNEVLAGALPLLADRADLQLLALTGPAHEEILRRPAGGPMALRVRVLPFLDRMELAYAVADLAVSRSGGTTIAELTVCGLPALLIPYPHATEHHQEANAREVERAGAAELLPDRELSPERLARRMLELVDDEERRRAMADRAAAWAKPDADARLADLVAEVARGAAR